MSFLAIGLHTSLNAEDEQRHAQGTHELTTAHDQHETGNHTSQASKAFQSLFHTMIKKTNPFQAISDKRGMCPPSPKRNR